MKLSTVIVHRVVACAFHGNPPSPEHVVDHIDTNRRKNRAENLRWVTRLDNILQNPATRKKVIAAYGSIEAFFENPQNPDSPRLLGQYDWMRTVSKDEASASRKRMEEWAESDARPKGGSLGEWLFATAGQPSGLPQETSDIDSQTPGATQRHWKTPCEFPACPDEATDDGLNEYKRKLIAGAVFSRNEHRESRVVEAEINESAPALIVLWELGPNAVKPWANSKVTMEDGKFCHQNLGSCFTLEGARKKHCLALGQQWEGGDSFDDYC